ncbi:MAG: lysophospholipid acyltransferase family protein, partial [Thiomicrorhabdus sp.]|nr:lysophospholipid acyltransferase family protein [Thiomicrorhabdus sp.]
LGTLLLVQEMFNKQHQEISFHIGKPIPWNHVESLNLSNKSLANRFRKHLYQLDKESKKHKKNSTVKTRLFKTIETVSHPANTKLVKKELKKSQLLGTTQDGKKIYLYDYQPDSPVMLEIGRLRELTFRVVGEGTGTAIDLDQYDTLYRHLVLWDDEELDIVGAYRIGECQSLIEKHGVNTLYSSTLFDLKPEMNHYLPYAIELG